MENSFNKDAFIDFLKLLATVPGPSLNEEPRRKVLSAFLLEWGIKSETDDAGNLWIHLGPEGWHDAIVFDAHMDVVEKGHAASVDVEGGRITGMGVGDNLTAVTMLALLARMITVDEIEVKKPLKILFSVGEEGNGNLKGVRQVVKDYENPPSLFISFDLSYDTIATTALGSIRYKVQFCCKGGHSWDNFGDPNAVEESVEFLGRLKENHKKISENINDPLTFNVGTISGGEGINSIARNAEAFFEFRSTNPELLDITESMLGELVKEFKARNGVEISCELTGARPAAESVIDNETLAKIKTVLSGAGQSVKIKPMSTNINIPLSKGWPSLCMGLCMCGGYHTDDEYVEINSLETGWKILCALSERLGII